MLKTLSISPYAYLFEKINLIDYLRTYLPAARTLASDQSNYFTRKGRLKQLRCKDFAMLEDPLQGLAGDRSYFRGYILYTLIRGLTITFSKQQKQHQKTVMKLSPQSPQSPHTVAPPERATSESQIFRHLSSSIEDLLLKITSVTNSYQYPTVDAPTNREISNDMSEHSPNTHLAPKEDCLFGHWHSEHSISTTETYSKLSTYEQKENLNCFRDQQQSSKRNPKTHQLPQGWRRQEQPHYQSLKQIGTVPRKIGRIHSLFEGDGIRQVAESTIFTQGGDGTCQRLQQTIQGLKQSMVGVSAESRENHPRQYCINDFEVGKEVGSGKFGEVFLCRHRATGMLFALKKIFKSMVREYGIEEQFALQLKILYWLDHPNIVKLYGHFDDEYHVFLLMEYLEGGELISRLGSTEQYVSRVIAQVIDAVDYMHGRGIVHRDIKPENIVVSFQDTIKLVDFGWAGVFDHKSMKTTFCGTLDYVSPQMKDKGEYSSKVDIWSLGVLTYQLLTREAPFKEEIANWKRKGSHRSQQWDWYIIYPPQISGLSESFMRNLLKENPDDRASLRYCKNHFFIRKYRESEEDLLQLGL